jgi:hypothetical protein
VIRGPASGDRCGNSTDMPRDVGSQLRTFNKCVLSARRANGNPHLATELFFDTLTAELTAEVSLHPEPWNAERQR